MNKKRDLILLVLFPIIAVIISFLFRASILSSILLFLGVPSLYLSIVNKKSIKKSALFAISFIPIGIIIDFFAVASKEWYVPYTIFPRIFGKVAVEDIIWMILFVYLVVMFYEYFLDKKIKKAPNKKFHYLITIFSIIFIAFLTFYFAYPPIKIPYFYLIWGIILILAPLIIFLLNFPEFTSRYAKVSAYTFSLLILHEITSLKLSQWNFSEGKFIGIIVLFGQTFPVEELLFLISLGAAAILSWYEFFMDDNK